MRDDPTSMGSSPGSMGSGASAATVPRPQVGEVWSLPLNGEDIEWRVKRVTASTVQLVVHRDYGTMEATCRRTKFLNVARRVQ